jgi:hypothetical protein
VLPDKEFVEVQLIRKMDQGNISIECQRWIFRRVMQRHHKE